MNLNNVTLTISAVKKAQYPRGDMPEIAFAGRSNVGKSSLINKLLNRKSLARVSSKPGKTATINFYNIDDSLYLVDLPGYGFARVSPQEKKKWAVMIDEYLNTRESLGQVILLVDSRHKPTEDDKTMLGFIRHACGRAVVVATKFDKLKKSQRDESLRMIITELELSGDDVIIPFSTVADFGSDELWSYINDEIMH